MSNTRFTGGEEQQPPVVTPVSLLVVHSHTLPPDPSLLGHSWIPETYEQS